MRDTASAICTLGELSPGESATVEGVEHRGHIGQRLMALGLMPGSRLKYVRAAPLGDPLMIELGGAYFCLRRLEAGLVTVSAIER